jgi:hypothetical protein
MAYQNNAVSSYQLTGDTLIKALSTGRRLERMLHVIDMVLFLSLFALINGVLHT